MLDIFNDAIQTTLQSFDFAFCIIANILTYLIIKVIEDITEKQEISTWAKRIVMLLSTGVVAVACYLCNVETKLIFNSIILTPVFWSWIGKPICKKFNIDYKK